MTEQPNSSGQTKPVYVVHGSDAHLRQQAVTNIKHDVLGVDLDPLACSEFRSDARLADVLDELRTLPLLTRHRLVIVVDADAFVREHREALERYCAQPAMTSSLLLICNGFDRRTRLHKAVEKIGAIVPCVPLKGRAVGSWIMNRASKQYGKRIDQRAAATLQRLAGDDLATLDNELLKLSTYVGEGGAIATDDVDTLIGIHREEKVFGIAEALARRDTARALELWKQAWRTERVAPARAVGGLAWALRRNLDGKIAATQGASYSQLARTFWKDPHEVKKLLEGVSLEELERQLRALLDADIGVKTGLSGTLQQAIEKLIVSEHALTRAG